MTSKRFLNLVKQARVIRFSSIEEIFRLSEPLAGIGLKQERDSRGINRKNKVLVSERQAIAFIRYQCLCLDGSFDSQEVNNLKWLFTNFVDVY